MTLSDGTVAIIGTGTIGSTLAAHLAAGGQDFLLAGRDADAGGKIAAGLDGHAEAVSVDEAVARADVLVVAVWLDDFRQLIAQYGERLAGKVIVDPSNPVGPDGEGGYRKVIGAQESSGQILAGLLPAGARLVKAFGTLSAGSLAAAAGPRTFSVTDGLTYSPELWFWWWQVLGSNQRRLSRRFYRRTSFATLQASGLQIYGHYAFAPRRRSVQVPHGREPAPRAEPRSTA